MFCVWTTHFYFKPDIYSQENGLAMGSPLSPTITNIYMNFYEDLALNPAETFSLV